MNTIQESRHYQQSQIPADAEDFVLMRSMTEQFLADWERFGMEGVYSFPEEMLIHSQELHCRQRTLGFNLIRSNRQIAGYNLTGMLDHGMTGEGAWTFWREWKPGIADTLRDGWAPLRWCLFASPMHIYSGTEVKLEAVLANENVLPPGEYPIMLRVCGPEGIAWEHRTTARFAAGLTGAEPSFVAPVFEEHVKLNGPGGVYQFAADLEVGGAAAGGRLQFHLSDPVGQVRTRPSVKLWGLEPLLQQWLEEHGVHCALFSPGRNSAREVVLIGDLSKIQTKPEEWEALLAAVENGATALFLSPEAFGQDNGPAARLPPQCQGRFYEFNDWLYHKECVANRHPVFQGLGGPGVMDWDYYGPVISRTLFEAEETPAEVIAAAFALGYACPGGYASGVMMGLYQVGGGFLLVNTFHILENTGTHPAADRLLLNVIQHAFTLRERH